MYRLCLMSTVELSRTAGTRTALATVGERRVPVVLRDDPDTDLLLVRDAVQRAGSLPYLGPALSTAVTDPDASGVWGGIGSAAMISDLTVEGSIETEALISAVARSVVSGPKAVERMVAMAAPALGRGEGFSPVESLSPRAAEVVLATVVESVRSKVEPTVEAAVRAVDAVPEERPRWHRLARLMYHAGMSLFAIAEAVGCSVVDLADLTEGDSR